LAARSHLELVLGGIDVMAGRGWVGPRRARWARAPGAASPRLRWSPGSAGALYSPAVLCLQDHVRPPCSGPRPISLLKWIHWRG